MLVTIIHVNLGQPLQAIIGNIHSLTEVTEEDSLISEQNLNDPQFSPCLTLMLIGAYVDTLCLSQTSVAERSPIHSRYFSLPTRLLIYPKTGYFFFLPIHSNKRARNVFPEINICTSAAFNRRKSC